MPKTTSPDYRPYLPKRWTKQFDRSRATMPASIDESPGEAARQAQLIRDAFERGQAALIAGAKVEALRWLERAHRLAPKDGTITLVLASAAIGFDNPKAAALFDAVLTAADVRDAWFGLATARFLMGDLSGARAAVAEVLGRHVVWNEITDLAGKLAHATGAAGWCGLTGTGVLVVHPVGPQENATPFDIQIDGMPLEGRNKLDLPSTWPQAGSATVATRGNRGQQHHLIGSPISLRAIGRVEGHVESFDDVIRCWAWYPADPGTDPLLSIEVGRTRREIVAIERAFDVRGLAPLACPRLFAISRHELPSGTAPIRVRGRDGLDLPGSPITGDQPAISRPRRLRHSAPVGSGASRIHTANSAALRRRRLDLAQWSDSELPAVLLVTHDDGGGVERRVRASVASHEALGRRAVVLRPAKSPSEQTWIVATSGSLPELRFELPLEQASLRRLLSDLQPVAAEFHHLLNHDASVFEVIRGLGIPYEAHVHDYAWFCPRIALVGRGDCYCGEPSTDVCQSCVTELGGYLHEDISIAALLDRSMTILSGAQRVVAPSHDAAARLARHFLGISPVVVPHEDEYAVAEPPPVPRVTGTVRICVAGAIGLHKGFDVLLACARDAKQRDLDLIFIVAGTTIDDQRLMETGRVFVTGPYQADEAVALIRAQDAALALLPSIWPETWCLGLTELWRAGLCVAAFDIGAPAERIRRTGRGFLFPLHLTPAAINDTLLKATRRRS
jgi:glycosyltransferase involved in cell wall biosynthesis